MIDSEDIKGNELITIGAIVSAIYAFGYISHIIKQYLLGIDFQLPETIILTNGADFLLSTIIDSIKFSILEPILKLKSFINENFLFSTILLIFVFILQWLSKLISKNFQKIQLIFLIIASLNILFFQTKLLDVSNILQPSNFNYIEDIRVNNYEGYSKKELSEEHYIRYVEEDNPSAYKYYFSPTEESVNKRLNHYSSVFIFIIMFTFIFIKNHKKYRLFSLFILLNLIFLPTTYAIIGNSIYYKNCHIKTKDNNLCSGILLAKSSESIIIYSKYDNFKITTIPNENVLSSVILNTQHLFSSEFNIRNFIISKHQIIDGRTLVELKPKGFTFFKNKFEINVKEIQPNLANGDNVQKNIPIKNLTIDNNTLTFYLNKEVKKIKVSIIDISNSDNEIIFPKISTATKNKVSPLKHEQIKKN